MSWRVVFTRQAQKDVKRLAQAGPRKQAERILAVVRSDPFQSPPRFEKLLGDLSGAYSRRVNIQHRIVCQVYEREMTVKVLRMWTHYE